MKKSLIMQIKRIVAYRPGSHRKLEKDLENISVEGLRELMWILKDFDDELSKERRSFRIAPGAPPIHG